MNMTPSLLHLVVNWQDFTINIYHCCFIINFITLLFYIWKF